MKKRALDGCLGTKRKDVIKNEKLQVDNDICDL